ncbi:AAA family ATPase [Paenibacillus sp. N1-5-1-14]|uniref:AAA family ATPase n=1 Tax=Paenibacillus radicibacter TaxID=2972488 RepID=UPI00215902EE|nr:AAA family ATPase [Paenibacillus radicibacter]MCR8641579.1 AAA family ATPase [Paenibacillus radicibacter]
MKPYTFVVVIEDQTYTEGMIAFLHGSGFGNKVELVVFTQPAAAFEYLDRSSYKPLVLVSEALEQEAIKRVDRSGVVVLHARSELQSNENVGEVGVYKYQPLTRLFNLLCAYESERQLQNAKSGQDGVSRTKVVSVFAAAGGCGKTTVSLHAAMGLVGMQHQVLYVSLESIGSALQLLKGTESEDLKGNTLSQLLYHWKTDASRLLSKLELLKGHDKASSLDYIVNTNQMREMEVMLRSDIAGFIAALKQTNRYDWIILDLETSVHPRILGALECSDVVLWLLGDDTICLSKTKAMKKLLPVMKEAHYIVNKYTGTMHNDLHQYDLAASYYLPYIPAWKTVSEPVTMLVEPHFQESIRALLLRFTSDAHVGGMK